MNSTQTAGELVTAVQIKLLTDNVTFLGYQQTVPVFAIPAHLIERGRELGLTVKARVDYIYVN